MDSVIQHEHLTRQLDIINVDNLNHKVVIIGCGAIGSFLTLSLVKMGLNRVEVFDHDKVDTVNMSNQFFRFKDIGTNKAEALKSLVKDFTNVDIMCNNVKFDETYGTKLKDAIVISAVDSMEARKLIMDLAAKHGAQYVIDPRMAAETYAQYAYPPKDFDKYAKTLYSDADAVQERCTAKSTIYTVNGAVSLACKTIKDIIQGDAYPKNIQWDVKATSNPMIMFPNRVVVSVDASISVSTITETLTDDSDDDENYDESEESVDDDNSDEVSTVYPAFMKKLMPSHELGEIVGHEALPRVEVVKRLWSYIKNNDLISKENRRLINADDRLTVIFGKSQVSMFEMTKIISKHLT